MTDMRISDFLANLYSEAEIKILVVSSALGGIITQAVGGFDKQLYTLLVFILVDYLTGMYAGYKSKSWWSVLAFRGLLKKTAIIAVVAFCYGVDCMLQIGVLRYGAIAGFGIMEAFSIIENADRGGWGDIFPLWIRDKLKEVKAERGLGKDETK